MSFTTVVASSLRCNSCRASVLRSFTSLAGVNILNSHPPPLAAPKPARPLQRCFATSSVRHGASRRSGNNDLFENDELVEGVDYAPLESHAQSQTAPQPLPELQPEPQESPIPWYLQQQPPSFATAQPQFSRQEIPELPPNPPPILSDLLEHISIQLGLDDLNLLDLRHLDPPPALGSKLLMIIGTARSEKHLHVSADRFCRWLRSTYKLRPHAAGLLGRNELKLKLRRKARRMKMMANAGASLDGKELDDGIRTGWICCTVGRVEAHELDKAGEIEQNENFIGFGKRSDGVNIVVQMFTEEKRAEIDLETLWGGVLRTAERDMGTGKEEEIVNVNVKEDIPQAQTVREEIPAEPRSEEMSKPRNAGAEQSVQYWPERTPSDVFPPLPRSPSRQQLRRLHTVGLRANA